MPEGNEPLTECDVAAEFPLDDVADVGDTPIDDVAGGSSDLRPSNSAQMFSSSAYTHE